MMRITTLCSAFILSILSLSLLHRNLSIPLHFRLTLCSLLHEAIKPAKTVKIFNSCGKSQSRESRYAFGGASEIFDAQTEYVVVDSETGYRFLFI